MKKKIINGLLMMALVVATTSSFVSCKDTVGDDNARFEEKFYQQDSYMKDVLLLQINNLRTDLSKIKNLNDGGYLGEVVFTTQYEQLLKDLEKLTKGINVPGTGSGSGSSTQSLSDWINAVNNMLNQLSGQGQSITSMLTTINTLNTLTNTLQNDLTALQTHLNDTLSNYYTKPEVDAMVNNLITDLNNHKVVIDQRLTQISDSLSAAYVKIAAANERIDSIKQNFATKKELADSVNNLRTEIAAAEKAAKDYADDLAKALDDKIKAANDRIDAANDRIDSTNITIGQIQNDVKALQEADEAIKTSLDALETSVKDLTGRVDAVEKDVKKIYEAINKQVTGIIIQGAYSPAFGIGMLPIDAKTNILAAYYGTSNSAIQFPAEDASNYVFSDDFWMDEEADFIDFTNAYKVGAKKILLSDADDNAGKLYLTVNPSQVDFTDKIIELENSQKKAAPIALAPLAKSNDKLFFGWTRGTSENGFYEAKAKITEQNVKDAQARIDQDALVSAAKDLYNNHNKASLKEAVRTIMSHNGDILDANAAKATYEGLNDNGEVENKTTFSEYSVAATVINPLSYNTLKGWNPQSIPGIKQVEKFINKIVDGIDIKINFGFNKIVVPTIKQIEIIELTEEMKAKFKFHLKVDSTLSQPEDPIQMTVPINVTGTATVVGGIVRDNNGNQIGTIDPITGIVTITNQTVTGTASPFKLEITVEQDLSQEIEELYGNLQEPMKNVNKMLADLQNFMNEIQPMLDKIANLDADINKQIEDAKNSVKSQLISYLEDFEKKILSYASYVNQAMQPVLLYKTNNGLARVSTIAKGASKMTGSVILVPTTYNAELMTPAFKKFIVCTGAWNADGSFNKTAAENANNSNENLNKVIDGQERSITFKGQSGIKYRIVYQALDYHGKIASGRYYVQF